MAISKLIRKSIIKLRYRKIVVSVYTNADAIKPITNPQFEVKIANKEKKSNHILIDCQLKNDTCYYVEINNELAHFSWLFSKNLLAKQLQLKNYFIIGNCETMEKYRGNSLYGIVVSKIITDNPNRNYALFIEPNNISSVKGVTKIGMQCIGTYEVSRFLGMSIKIKKI